MHFLRKAKTNPGFSLVELLVVIGVLAILGALVFAGYRKAVVRSQSMVCASNMRQVWQATLLYVNDHQGELPEDGGTQDYGPRKMNGLFTGAYGKVASLLAPYVGDEVWFCPDPAVIEFSESQASLGRVWRKRGLTGLWSGSPYDRDRNENEKKDPDVNWDLLVNWDNLDSQFVFTCYPLSGQPYPHDEILNFLAMDGHVETRDYGK